MKIDEIAKIEDANEDSIILIKEGLFWRAYERSARRFAHLITKYQLIRKEFKALGRSMVYLGFPETRLKQVITRAKIKGWSVEEPVSGQNWADGPKRKGKAGVLRIKVCRREQRSVQ